MNHRAYFLELQNIIHSLPPHEKTNFLASFVESEKNPVAAFCLSVFLGMFGVDRIYVGDSLIGFLKLITLGGFGVWAFIDLFFIAGRTRDRNIELARLCRSSIVSI